jgi:hypothetical protein
MQGDNMKKVLVLMVILTVSIFLTGCGQTTTTGKTFIGGTEGLRISFLPGQPPDTITDSGTSSFGIGVKLENVGESTIKAGDLYVQILGIDSGIYGETQYPDFKRSTTEDIRGAVKNYDGSVLNGGVSVVDFGELKYLGTSVGDLTQTPWADVCYKYTTQMASQICIKSNIEQALSSKDICEVEGEKDPQNSGAPLQVTSLKESYAGTDKIGLTLTITHSGTGDNFFKATDGQAPVCNNVLSESTAGMVRVVFSPVQVSGKTIPVVCQSTDGQGYIKLYADSSTKATYNLYCTIDITGINKNVVEVPLQGNLTYVYLQHITKDMTLRHISTG